MKGAGFKSLPALIFLGLNSPKSKTSKSRMQSILRMIHDEKPARDVWESIKCRPVQGSHLLDHATGACGLESPTPTWIACMRLGFKHPKPKTQ